MHNKSETSQSSRTGTGPTDQPIKNHQVSGEETKLGILPGLPASLARRKSNSYTPDSLLASSLR
jgi:hypothetical protein